MNLPDKHKKRAELYENIRTLIDDARKSVSTTINTTMVHTYFEIGRMIVEDEQQGKERAAYGKETLKELSEKLTQEFGKGFSEDNLSRMRSFYLVYGVESTGNIIDDNISATVSRKFTLSWSHYLVLIRIDDNLKRSFYETESQKERWSVRELKRQIDSALFERLALNREKKEIRIYIDLVFYNRLLRSFVLIDLKKGDLKHQDIGQMQMYVNYFDREEKTDDENPTVGIVLCMDKSDMLVKYTLPEDNEQIFASKYKLYLPDKDELKTYVEQIRQEVNDA